VLTATALASLQNTPAIEQIAVGGMLATIGLIASLSVAEIMVESKCWNGWASSTLEMQNTPLLLVFLAIVAFKVLMVL